MITKEDYVDILNDSYAEVSICGGTYMAGTTWRKIDPVSFDEAYWTFIHSQEDAEETA